MLSWFNLNSYGFQFAIAFAFLTSIGQIVAYSRGMRPAMDYATNRRPGLTRRQFQGTVIRTIGYIATALVCSAVHHIEHAWSCALRLGLVTGIVTGVGVTVNPYIEYYADNLPERRSVSALHSSFAALPCSRSNTGWRCSTCG